LSSSSETREIWTEIKYYENILDFDLLHEFVLRAGRSGWTQSREVAKARKGKKGKGEIEICDLSFP
jgi:hypothetical protein